MQILLFLTGHVIDDVALVHHDEAVAILDGILHVMGDHHGCQMIAVYDHVCDLENLGCRLRIKSSSVLIQKKKLRLF